MSQWSRVVASVKALGRLNARAPAAAALVHVSESRAYRVLLVIAGAVLQLVWVGWLWHWKQLPGGGDYPP